jgi:2'-5' RNA ligase
MRGFLLSIRIAEKCIILITMLTLQNKLYIQLAPDTQAITAIQNDVEGFSGRSIESEQLHLTVLHIGKLERLYDSVYKETDISKTAFLEEADALASELEILKAKYDENHIELNATEFDVFGANRSVLVLRFETTDTLNALHASGLDSVRKFLQKCGIRDMDDFIEKNDSLKHSLSYKPHIALKKAFEGKVPVMPNHLTVSLTFSIMSIEYDT